MNRRIVGEGIRTKTTARRVGRRPIEGRPSMRYISGEPRRVEVKALERNPEAVRFVPLGGLEEIGRNMMFFEYGDEIVIIDAGLQFPEEDTPGIDFIIPNIEYLQENKRKIKALLITHGHLDHIGAIPYIMEKIGNPPIYSTALSNALIKKRYDEFPNAPKITFMPVKIGDEVKISQNFSAYFFGGSHTIPDAISIVLRTPAGNFCNPGDFRIDRGPKGEPRNLPDLERVGRMGIQVLFMESTRATVPGESMPEKVAEENLEKILNQAKGRIIVTTFASLLDRLGQVINIAHRLGRKVALSGRSMKDNIQITQNLGYIKIPKGALISLEEVSRYDDNKILILSTGNQGEPNSGLARIVSGDHKQIRIKPGDTVVFSSSIIPGNERGIQTMKDNLARQGAIIFDSSMMDIHAGGHGPQEDLKLAIKAFSPKFFVPIHGMYFMRQTNTKNAQAVGVKAENCLVMDNGQVAEITKETIKLTKETVPAYYVMVDGLGVGDVGEVVLRDRLMLAQEGMIVIITTLDKRSGRIIKNPDIISRGFIYLKDNREILDEIRRRIRSLISRIPTNQPIDADYFKGLIRDQIGQFIFHKTQRRPMLLPVVIEI